VPTDKDEFSNPPSPPDKSPHPPFAKGGLEGIKSRDKGGLKTVAIIPARYGSTRLPGKPLLDILGKPMIQHVWERTVKAREVEKVIVATDDEKVLRVVKDFGGEVTLTSKEHLTGTDRIAEVVRGFSLDVEIIVNVQGDEPLIEPDMIDQVVKILAYDPKASMGTLCRKISDIKEIVDTNVVKVVFDKEFYALYFSRLPIPYYRNDDPKVYFKHLGIYSYRRDALLRLSSAKSTPLENAERLEQLRALENGFRIKVAETDRDTIGVDTEEDLEMVRRRLRACRERSPEPNGTGRSESNG
jgi:3-deoxy-manno-octulosonate cytidylyltransferase (CMP-KDO synthetase)